MAEKDNESAAYECAKHGPYGPSRFCCACTREAVEAERNRYRRALLAIAPLTAEGIAPEILRVHAQRHIREALADRRRGQQMSRFRDRSERDRHDAAVRRRPIRRVYMQEYALGTAETALHNALDSDADPEGLAHAARAAERVADEATALAKGLRDASRGE